MNKPHKSDNDRSDMDLSARVEALRRAIDIADGRLDQRLVGAASVIADKVSDRMGHGTSHTVVALAGSTGVGKSSLFNSLVGVDVSAVGVRRPTTGVAHAAVWGEGAESLLDWLGVGRRHHVHGTESDAAAHRSGLVLLDLPDFDSTETSNRAEVDRLVELVDAMIWVVDPQKYADAALHDGYLRPLSGHGDVLRFVVNKIDTVPAEQHQMLLEDFARRLDDDGIHGPHVIAASTANGDGLDSISALLTATLAERRVIVDRLSSDLAEAATALSAKSTGADAAGVSEAARRDLVEQLGRAAGADAAGAVVERQHRKDARMALGWPLLRLGERFRRRHPISELPRASASAAARSEIELAVRDVAESVSGSVAGGLEAPWPHTLRSAAGAHTEPLTTKLTAITDDVARAATSRPSWWAPVVALQRVFTAAAIVGAVWLLVVAVLGGFFRLATDPLLIDTPGLDWIPLPSLLVLGGLALGFIASLLVRVPVGISARRRGGLVRRRLLDRIGDLADETVLADIDAVLADRRRLATELAIVRGR